MLAITEPRPAAPPADVVPPALPAAPTAAQPLASARPSGAPQSGIPLDIPIRAEPLVAMARLGDELLQRIGTDFPSEIAWPVHVRGDIRARYPATALDERREGSVVLWIVVDTWGKVDEIKVAEGDDDFAQAAIEAVNGAQFDAAGENGVSIRYPIALEFRFVLPPAIAPADAVTAATR